MGLFFLGRRGVRVVVIVVAVASADLCPRPPKYGDFFVGGDADVEMEISTSSLSTSSNCGSSSLSTTDLLDVDADAFKSVFPFD